MKKPTREACYRLLEGLNLKKKKGNREKRPIIQKEPKSMKALPLKATTRVKKETGGSDETYRREKDQPPGKSPPRCGCKFTTETESLSGSQYNKGKLYLLNKKSS